MKYLCNFICKKKKKSDLSPKEKEVNAIIRFIQSAKSLSSSA